MTSIAWAPDGRGLASLTERSGLRVWDTESSLGRTLPTPPEYAAATSNGSEPSRRSFGGLSWAPAGRLLTAETDGPAVALWNVCDNTVRLIDGGISPHSPTFDGRSFSWSPDGRSLALVGREGGVRLHDIASGKHRTLGPEDKPFQVVSWARRGEHVAAAGESGVYVWSVMSGEGRRVSDAGDIERIAWHADGDLLAIGSAGAGIDVITIKTGERVTVREPQGRLLSLRWIGRSLLLTRNSEVPGRSGTWPAVDPVTVPARTEVRSAHCYSLLSVGSSP